MPGCEESRQEPLAAVVEGVGPSHFGAPCQETSACRDWSGLPCEARFWERKLGPAKVHYLLWLTAFEGPHV